MTETTRWWWVRHAPVSNPDGVIYGHSDFAAEPSGLAEMQALAACLPRDAVWITTSLRRARDTAQSLARYCAPAAALREDDGFREQSFGEWEGSRWDELPAAESAAYWHDPVALRAPGGESFADVVERVAAAMDRLNGECAGGDVVVVAHAGSIRAGLVHALGCAPQAGLAFRLDPLSLTRMEAIRRDGALWWRVAGVNLPGIARDALGKPGTFD